MTLAEKLSAYLGTDVGELRQYPSGFSWLTYGFRVPAPGISGLTELILRLGPQTGLFAPYSAVPQFEALTAVRGTRVPAPLPVAWSDDESILGAPFFVCEKAVGDAPLPWGDGPGLAEDERKALGAQFADALGELHVLDPKRFRGGGDITKENAAARELDVWEASFRRWALRPHPMMHRALAWLRAHLPRAARVSIVHGDYRLGNFLAKDGKITAILDWELVHLGDPHEDLAWTCLPAYRMSYLLSREELFARHEAKTGLPVREDAMHFYTVFCLMKIAAVHMAGAHAFERNGFYDMRMPAMSTQIAPTFRQIEKAMEVKS